ncbi:hypothetical protein NCCP133_16850 [Cytobacillus sp. NCCP-133]|nr:hypothetical protein NCCP133_16850 [Cytobacillus sp. NCCP-133]
MNRIMVIGISAGVGKSTFSRYLDEAYKPVIWTRSIGSLAGSRANLMIFRQVSLKL